MKAILKATFEFLALVLAMPAALACGFGRVGPVYGFFAQSYALVPGLPGDYLRTGFYRLTLQGFGQGSRIQFGSYFAHASARVGKGVYIGTLNILGRTEIGDGCQIASGVQILSGKGQHLRKPDGSLSGAEQGSFETVRIGCGCWIGAGCIVMADVGDRTTVGAGSVVTKPLPADCTAVGVPARVLESVGQKPEGSRG
jgi:acetyltransferase-like isoleucine patch superfamily enzyme